MAMRVTFFRDFAAQRKIEEAIAAEDLADLIRTTSAPAKEALPWLKLALFGDARSPKGSLRHDLNVRKISGIEADYDAGVIGFDQAVEIADKAGLHCIVYTSPSHSPAKPRWRVLAPASAA